MNKKQILALTIVGLVIFGATFFGVYLLKTNDDNKPKEKEAKNIVELKNYTLEYGTYIGEEKEYNPNKELVETKKVMIVLTKDKIGDQKYTVKENSLYVQDSYGQYTELYEVKGNNEFTMLAGAGIKYKLSK